MRTVLYVPASNDRAVAKARGLGCDAVILDLEDAVAPERKGAARAAAVAAVADGLGGARMVVRVNAPDTPWGADDMAAFAGGPAALLLPKVADAAGVAAAVARAGGARVWAMVETPAAVLRLDGIAGVAGLDALVMGTNDLAKDLRARVGADRAALLPHLAATVAAARAHGRIALDGVWNAVDDLDGLAAEAAQGAGLGFDGKTIVHPAQIAAVRAAFAPDAAQIAWARAVRAAFADPAAAGRGAIRLGGAMVERLHLAEAERILAEI